MVDVAKSAGVSQKTVSRVINGAPHVRPEVRARVLAAVAELDYRPNAAARALASQRTYVIGVVAVDVTMFGPAARVHSLEQAARERGYQLSLTTLEDVTAEPLRAAVRGLLERGCEGLVLELPNPDVDLDDALLQGVPVATRVGQVPGLARQVVASSDQTDGGRLATQHLLDLGHETVWHLAGPADYVAARERRVGWSAALSAAGRRQPSPLHGDWSARSGYELGRQLAACDDVTAVFTANDHQAMGLMRSLSEAGRSVPGDVSVVGFDDVPEAEYCTVPLTTVRTNDAALSHRVLSELVGLIEGLPPAAEAHSMHRELVVRQSTAPPRPRRTGPAAMPDLKTVPAHSHRSPSSIPQAQH